jgi:hypothetical protein
LGYTQDVNSCAFSISFLGIAATSAHTHGLKNLHSRKSAAPHFLPNLGSRFAVTSNVPDGGISLRRNEVNEDGPRFMGGIIVISTLTSVCNAHFD